MIFILLCFCLIFILLYSQKILKSYIKYKNYKKYQYKDSEYIILWRNEMQYFESTLRNPRYEYQTEYNLQVRNHVEFIEYCYYIKLHQKSQKLSEILYSENIIGQYKTTFNRIFCNSHRTIQCSHNLNGCTALTAAILSRTLCIERKRRFIKKLLYYGFIPTNDDKIFAELQVYDAITMKIKINIMLFLNNENLLIDIKWYIVKCLIDVYKIYYYPLDY